MAPPPQSVVYIRPDTIGDLVIFQAALVRLQQAWPEAKHTVVVRPGYEALAPLFPGRLHWLTAALNPFKQPGPAECWPELEALRRQLEGLAPDLILAPALSRTWLEAAVAAQFPRVRSVVLGSRAVDPIFAAALALDLGVDAARAFGETVPVGEGERDWENQHRFVDHLLGATGARPAPAVAVPPAAVRRAGQLLAEWRLPPGQWAAVFVGGLANVQVKAWGRGALRRADRRAGMSGPRLARPAAGARERSRCPCGGGRGDRARRRTAAAPMARAGRRTARPRGPAPAGPPVYRARHRRPAPGRGGRAAGRDFRRRALAALPQGRSAGRPWPIVQPLPCFGCNWDCYFGNGPCVKTLAVADVRRGVERILAAADRPLDEVIEARHLSGDALQLIADVAPRRATPPSSATGSTASTRSRNSRPRPT